MKKHGPHAFVNIEPVRLYMEFEISMELMDDKKNARNVNTSGNRMLLIHKSQEGMFVKSNGGEDSPPKLSANLAIRHVI